MKTVETKYEDNDGKYMCGKFPMKPWNEKFYSESDVKLYLPYGNEETFKFPPGNAEKTQNIKQKSRKTQFLSSFLILALESNKLPPFLQKKLQIYSIFIINSKILVQYQSKISIKKIASLNFISSLNVVSATLYTDSKYHSDP